MTKLGIIVATKDRPDDLRAMLESLAEQTRRPDQVVVVDASKQPVEEVATAFDESFTVTYRRHWPPSAAAQRNAGLAALEPQVTLVGFMDDDIVVAPDGLEELISFWDRQDVDLGGAALNEMNGEDRTLAGLKSSRAVSALGLYSGKPGHVAPSGWQSVVDKVDRDQRVEWLHSGASVWRKDVLDEFRFDPFFDGYSYLEDLDFSYTVSRHYSLAVVADARFWHYPSPSGRVSRFNFGFVEVRNRLYFVRKHGLSTWRCYLGLLLRFGMTLGRTVGRLDKAAATRAGGNLLALARFGSRSSKLDAFANEAASGPAPSKTGAERESTAG